MFDFLKEGKFEMWCKFNYTLGKRYDKLNDRLLRYTKEKSKLEKVDLIFDFNGFCSMEYRKENYITSKQIGKLNKIMCNYNLKNLTHDIDPKDFSRECLKRYYEKSKIEQDKIYQNAKELIDNIIIELKKFRR